MDLTFLGDFLLYQNDYVLFFHGATLCTLAAACFVMRGREEDELPWALLAAFGLLHGFHEWLEIIAPAGGGELFFEIFDSFLIIASFLMLFEFGRRGNHSLIRKIPAPWIFVPLLGLTAGSWFKVGWTGLSEAAVFFLLLPGGLLAAWALFSAFRRIKSWPRYLIAACSLMMALYVLGAILIAQVPYLRSSLIDIRILTLSGALTSDLTRGILSMGMAFTLSLYSQSSGHAEAMLHYFRRRSLIAFWLSTCSVVLVVISGWFFVQYLDDTAMKEHKYRAGKSVELMDNKWLFFVNTIQRDVWGIANSSSAVRAVASEGKNWQRAAADLEDYKLTHGAEVCYLLDARGKVLVSSYLGGFGSMVGEDFSHHPYMRQALMGGEGSLGAFGLATKKRGFFASHPIYDGQGKVIGVTVIKRDIDSSDLNFDVRPDIAFLISSEGIIFFSSHAQMVGMSLWPLSEENKAALAASRQFGAGPFKALLQREPKQDDKILFAGKRYLVTRRSVVEPQDWSLVLLSIPQEVFTYRLLGIVIVVLFFSLIIGFFIVLEKSLASAAQIAVTENRFRALFEGAPGAIYIMEKGTRKILSANNFMADWLDYKPEELLSLTLDDLRVSGEKDTECRYRKRNGILIYVEEVRREISFHGRTAYLIIAHDIDDRKKAEELLNTLSMSDGLTGIANRRRFDEFLAREWQRAIRGGTEISLIMCDIDFFKNYNDTYGHQAGDDCLKRVAVAIRDKFHRSDDLAARYGGEEFAVIMSGMDLQGACSLAKAVHAAVAALGIPHANSAVASVVTLSLGVATVKAQRGSSADELLVAAADQALYQAKKEGRNRVVASPS